MQGCYFSDMLSYSYLNAKKQSIMIFLIIEILLVQVNVHLDCYHSLKNPRGPWRCEVCEESPPKKTSPSTNNQLGDSGRLIVRCALCGNSSGAFRKTMDGLWVHAFCAEVYDSLSLSSGFDFYI